MQIRESKEAKIQFVKNETLNEVKTFYEQLYSQKDNSEKQSSNPSKFYPKI